MVPVYTESTNYRLTAMSGRYPDVNLIDANMKDEVWNITQNNKNHITCLSPEKTHDDVGKQDNDKKASPGDALLGKNNDNDSLTDNQTVLDIDNRVGEENPKDGRQCSANLWLATHRYTVFVSGLVMFIVGCTLLAISVYFMQTSGRCDKQSSFSMSPSEMTLVSDNVTTIVQSLPLASSISLPTYSYQNITPSTTAPTKVPSTTQAVILKNNIALGRPAYQSSTMVDQSVSYHASLATDGAEEYLFSNGSCSRTNLENRPFWYVDLGRFELVQTVRIFTPRDLPAGELQNFEVRIGQGKDLDLNPLCKHYVGAALVFTLTVRCHRPMYGRYVSIVLLGDKTRSLNRLTLCEVQVYNR